MYVITPPNKRIQGVSVNHCVCRSRTPRDHHQTTARPPNLGVISNSPTYTKYIMVGQPSHYKKLHHTLLITESPKIPMGISLHNTFSFWFGWET